MRITRALVAIVLCTLALNTTGCVGPMKLKRGLDQHYNQFYVDNPVITELASPIIIVGGVAASAVDYTIVNPVFWWKDALRGRGTPYFYKNPEVPLEE